MAKDKTRQSAMRNFQHLTSILEVQVATLWVWGGLRTRMSKRGTTLKSGYFTAFGSYSVKTIADRYTNAA